MSNRQSGNFQIREKIVAKNQKTKTKDQRPKTDKLQLKSRMKNLLMFLPNLVALCFRLLRDARVPLADKALFIGAIIYVISPLDFIPDLLPFIGQVDDIYLVALTLLRLINRADETVVREHWTGGGDIVQLSDSIAKLAPALLPPRVNRILKARVELAPNSQILEAVKTGKTPIVREVVPIEPKKQTIETDVPL